MKPPPPDPAAAINPDSVLILNQALGRDHAEGRSEEETSLLALIDGKRTVAEILQLSRMSGFVAMRRLRSLIERDVIRPGPRVGPQALRGAPRGGRLGLTQDLTSAAEAFAASAQSRRPGGAETSGNGSSIGQTAPGMTNHSAADKNRVSTPPGSAGLPSVIIAFGPEFLDSRRAPTRRISSPDSIPQPPPRTAAPASVAPAGEAPRRSLADAPAADSRALVPASGPQRHITTVTETTVMPSVGQRPRHRRRGTPHSNAEIQAQELWLSVTRRDWQTLAVVSADGGGAALSVASALAEAGSLLRGKTVELFVADGADLANSGDWSWGARNSQPISLPTGGLPPASEKFERLVALEPISANPRGITIAQGAEAVLMVAEAGHTELRAARKALEMIGRDRFLGCVLVSRR